jgi:hypothetical protein
MTTMPVSKVKKEVRHLDKALLPSTLPHVKEAAPLYAAAILKGLRNCRDEVMPHIERELKKLPARKLAKAGPVDEDRDERGRWTSGGSGQMLSDKDHATLQMWLTGSDDPKNTAAYNALRVDPKFGDTLARLPGYKGDMYRGAVLPPQEIAALKVGANFDISKFSSASKAQDLAYTYAADRAFDAKAGTTPVLFSFEGGRAADVSRATGRPIYMAPREDEEVIVPMGDRYKITAVNSNYSFGGGLKGLHVTMKRVK